MNNIATEPREKLKEIISRNGDEILQDQDRCEGLLKDHCGLHRREIAALVGALEERVPLELKSSWQSAMTPEAMRSRLVQRMQDNRGLTPDLADWAVDAWSYALGVGLGRKSDRLPSVVVSTPKAAVNPEMVREFGHAAQQPKSNSQPQVVDPEVDPQVNPQAPAAGQWSSQKKGIAAAAAAVALYFAYSNGLFPIASAKQIANCPEGQTRAADGTCVAIPKDGKNQPVGPDVRPKNVPKMTTALTAGTAIPVTISETLNSDTVTIGQYVKGIVNGPVVLNGKTMVPEGTHVILQVSGVDQAGKVLGAARIDLALVEMTVNGKKYNLSSARGVVTGPSKTVQTAKGAGIWGGIGTAAGCGIGKIFGRTGTGCAAGAAGGATTGVLLSAKDKPKPAILEPGKVVRFKLGQSVNLA